MLHRLVRFAILRLLKLFYPRIEIRGRENLPTDGPLIFVLNHPNGLLDPLVLMAGIDRRVSFLAKNTLFNNPLGRLCMQAFGAVPVYRQRDQGMPGDTATRNERTFARCRELLRQHNPLALFPEGTTHSEPSLLPLRTGAARIALGAEAETEWTLGLHIVPVGLWYQNKTLFRSAALVVVGQPFTITEFQHSYAIDQNAAIHALTDQIADSLDPVVLQAEHAEIVAGMPLVAAWTAPNGPPQTLAQRHARTATLIAAYEHLIQTDAARIAALTHEARRYARTLRALGIADPWALELDQIRPGRQLRQGLLLLLSLPLAAAGFALSYGPYRLAGVLTPRFVGHYDTLYGTGKIIIGAALITLGWLLIALSIGSVIGAMWGGLLLAISPLLAYIALRWGESWHNLRDALAYSWLRIHHQPLRQHLIARRHQLAAHIADALAALPAEHVEAQPMDQTDTKVLLGR